MSLKPLAGKLVVALEQAVAAPLCTARMAAAGARVIKIEREEGDFARGYDQAALGESSYFTWLNQGKQSACINFKTEEGAALLTALLAKADVLVQNLSPGALGRAGFSSDAVQAINPKLIICNISGYGEDGDVANLPAYDLLVQAESGLISVSGALGHPGRIGVSVCDIAAGTTAYYGVLEALLKRELTGEGEELSVSLFDVAADWMAVPYLHAEYGKAAPAAAGLQHPSIAPYGAFECSDGRLVLISIQNEREWQRLCTQALHAPELLEDGRFSSNNERVENRAALEKAITKITMQMTSQTFAEHLQAAKIAYGQLNGASDLRGHPAFHGATHRTSEGKSIQMPAAPVRWSKPETETVKRSPKTGEHTDQIIAEFTQPAVAQD